MVALGGRMKADQRVFGSARVAKRTYVKPLLATHGSVERLTLGSSKGGGSPHSQDCGSHITFKPTPFGGKWFGD